MRWYSSYLIPVYFARRLEFGVSSVTIQRRSGGPLRSNNVRLLPTVLAAVTLAACSIHPIPDDVSPIPTEAIVAAARCELRLGLVEMVKVWFADEVPPVRDMDPDTIAEHLQEMKKRFPKVDLVNDWNVYMDVAIAYDWTFDITETNHADAGTGFRLPLVNPVGNLDASTSANITTVRSGKRTFKNQDKFSSLLSKRWYNFCNDIDRSVAGYPNTPGPGEPFVPRDPNFIYPISGSIGLARAVQSFLKVSVQEGGLDTFTDELTFTTTLDGKAGAGLTLAPVPQQFRLVNASVNIEGSRVDLHKVKISLAFPRARPTQKTKKQLVADLLKEMDAKGGYNLNPGWRASYALCVIDGRSREDELKSLRLKPPEVSCLESTDAFFPRGNGITNALLTGRRKDLWDEKKGLELQKRLDERDGSRSP